MPSDIRNPFHTERIRPATNIRKNDFIGIKYMKVIKKICLFLIPKSLQCLAMGCPKKHRGRRKRGSKYRRNKKRQKKK